MATIDNLGFHCHGLDHFDEAIIHHGLRRGEFYNFPPEEYPELRRRIAQHDLGTSLHAPVKRLDWYPNPPTLTFLCEADDARRELSLRMIEDTMSHAHELGADHVVVHFPSPGSADGRDTRTYEEALRVAWQSAESLADMTERYGVPIHIEGFGPSPFLKVEFVARIVSEFPGLWYCFDTGHMHLQSPRFGFDVYEFARGIAACIGSVHLWNNRGIDDYLAYRHIPAHPSQRPEEGWGDLRRILEIVLSESPDCIMILESGLHYPEALGGHDISEGVAWVKEIIAAFS